MPTKPSREDFADIATLVEEAGVDVVGLFFLVGFSGQILKIT